jgi:hypothetical protein
MKMKWIFLMTAAALIVGLAGCASSPQPFVYHDDRDEKPGPGHFSGEEGGFVVYGESADKPLEKEKAAVENAQPEKDPE